MQWTEAIGLFGAAASGLLTLVVALIAVIYRNDREVSKSDKEKLERRVDGLVDQNTAQETKIATLAANASNHDASVERLADTIERLDTKVDEWSRSMTSAVSQLAGIAQQITRQQYERKQTPPPFSSPAKK